MSLGRIVRWALEEAGAGYETVVMECSGSMKEPEYLAINPMGKVAAIRHDGQVVTEAAAICTCLAEAFPDAGLAPTSEEHAAYYRWLFFAAGPLEYATSTKALGQDSDDRFGTYDDTIDTAEGVLSQGDYVCGGRFTMVDVYFGSHIEWGLGFGTIPKRLAFEAYVGRICDRDAYKRARRIGEVLIAERKAAVES